LGATGSGPAEVLADIRAWHARDALSAACQEVLRTGDITQVLRRFLDEPPQRQAGERHTAGRGTTLPGEPPSGPFPAGLATEAKTGHRAQRAATSRHLPRSRSEPCDDSRNSVCRPAGANPARPKPSPAGR